MLCCESAIMPGEGGGLRQGERERQIISILELSVCLVPVLHDTCDFSSLSFNVTVCYAIYVIVLDCTEMFVCRYFVCLG